MSSFIFLLSLLSYFTLTKSQSEPAQYILSFPTQDNYLNITVVQPYSKNYFLTIGDWGAERDSPDVSVQRAVAQKMIDFVNNQTAQGMNLLFILSVGDNFYYTGQNCDEWEFAWSSVYGSLATDYYWFNVMGNHDWGDSDKYAMCAWNHPFYTDPNTNIPYACNQLSADKGGCAPNTYIFPDFGYYYTINELEFEFIALEESADDCPNGIGGGYGNSMVFDNCGNGDHMEGRTIGCGYLTKIQNATENMMLDRAKNSQNTNFILSQHYPSEGKRLVDNFKSNRANADNEIIVGIYGHAHQQECNRETTDPYGRPLCDEVRTGGGGGCCFQPGASRGFYVMQFDDNKHMYQPLAFDNPAIECKYPCDQRFTPQDIERFRYQYCCITTEKDNYYSFDCGGIKCEL